MKSLPKSLHTVTVLTRIAATYIEKEGYPIAEAMDKALQDLGYADAADSYGLAAAAIAQISKGKESSK